MTFAGHIPLVSDYQSVAFRQLSSRMDSNQLNWLSVSYTVNDTNSDRRDSFLGSCGCLDSSKSCQLLHCLWMELLFATCLFGSAMFLTMKAADYAVCSNYLNEPGILLTMVVLTLLLHT